MKLEVRWLTMTKVELEKCQAQYGLLTQKELRTLMQAAEHTNCSCPLPPAMQKHRRKMKKQRCGDIHVRIDIFPQSFNHFYSIVFSSERLKDQDRHLEASKMLLKKIFMRQLMIAAELLLLRAHL